MTYEKAMLRLEELAAQMEKGEVGVEEMEKHLKEAQSLLRFCRDKLYAAEESCKALFETED